MTDTATVGRHIELDDVFNLRDLGGYTAAGGRVVRRGLVYRADGLHRLAGAGVAGARALGWRTIIDLRTAGERADRGVAPDALGCEVVHLALLEATWEPASWTDTTDVAEYLAARYYEMFSGAPHMIVDALRLMADTSRLPLVFHCAAGKDRTGVVAATVLHLLGVDDRTIARDYALSGPAMVRLEEWLARQRPDWNETMAAQPHAFMASPPVAMQLFLDVVRAEHGSARAALAPHGLDDLLLDRLRSALLH
jgi:protein-tyrosine phosphatase